MRIAMIKGTAVTTMITIPSHMLTIGSVIRKVQLPK